MIERERRGELPMEVKESRDEMEGLNKRVEKIEEEIRSESFNSGKEKYHWGQSQPSKNTKNKKANENNREFDSLNKEIEDQELEAQLAEKRIKENLLKIDNKKELLEK